MTRRLLVGALCAIAVYVVSAWPTVPSMVDDAYVSLRYARNLALGHGLVYNAGEPPVEGYTNFLWVLWMAPGTLLPVHPSTWAAGWGLAFAAAALVCATGLTATLCGHGSPWALLPAAVLAPLPALAVATTNGLETAMYLAVLLAAAWALLDGRRLALGGALAGLLYLVRPEGIAAAAVLVASAGFAARADGPRSALRPAAAALAVVLPYFAARAAYFGTWGPNTFAAQAREPFLEMFAMNARYYGQSAELYAGALALAALGFVGLARAGEAVALRRLTLLAIAAGLAIVAMRVYNWMPGARLFLAPIALATVASAPAIRGLPPLARRGALALLLAWTGWHAFGPPRATETLYDARNTALPDNEGERLGRAVAAAAPPGAWLLARDAGVVPYFAGPDVHVIDIHPYSLTDPHLTGKPFDVDHLLARDPAFLVTTAMTREALPTSYPQEKTLLADARVEGRYVPRTVAFQHFRRWYRLWVREDLAAAFPEAAEATPPRARR